jgi:DNA polymerase-3 subunit delta
MIIYLWGEDTYRSREHLHLIRQKFIRERDPSELNTRNIDLSDATSGNILFSEICAAPFLAERRMVIIEHIYSAKKDLLSELLNIIEEQKIPESTVMVIWHDGGMPKTKDAKLIHERLTQEKFVQEFERLEGAKLAGWIAAQAKEHGLQIQPAALQYLTQESANNTWQIGMLMDQLTAYLAASGRAMVEMKDVALFFQESADDHMFALIDAIVGRQGKQVYSFLLEQYSQGDDAGKIYAMLARQFRILLELRDLYERKDGLSSDMLAKELGVHPFVVKKSLALIRQYTRADLEKIYANLLQDDIHLKTGYADGETILEERIAQLLYQAA